MRNYIGPKLEVRLPEELAARLDACITESNVRAALLSMPRFTKAEAIRVLLDRALCAEGFK